MVSQLTKRVSNCKLPCYGHGCSGPLGSNQTTADMCSANQAYLVHDHLAPPERDGEENGRGAKR